jgi:hypothetical protein
MEKVRGVFRDNFSKCYPIEVVLMKSESTDVEKPKPAPKKKLQNKSGLMG